MRRAFTCVGLAIVALLLPAAQALGGTGGAVLGGGLFTGLGRVVSYTQIPVRVRGGVDIDFHGDSGAECLARGLCDLDGTVAWKPLRSAQLAVLRGVHRGRLTSAVLLNSYDNPFVGSAASTTARVRRALPGGDAATCADVVGAIYGFVEEPVQGNVVRIGVAGDEGSGMNVGTRCGGPLNADVARALPVQRVSMSALRRGKRTIDLRGERSFSVHGLAGTVHSSVVLRLGSPDEAFVDNEEDPELVVGHRRMRQIDVSYDVASVRGKVATTFEGLRDRALCAPLAACDLSGRGELAPQAAHGSGELTVEGPAGLPRRALLAAVGLAPGRRIPGLSVYGSIQWHSARGQATTSVTRFDDTSCSDSVPVREGYMNLHVANRTVHLSYAGEGGADPVRTRCPGPLLEDVSTRGPLAVGSAPLRTLGRRRLTLRLAQGRGFSGDGYHGHTSSTLSVRLRRVDVEESVFNEPVYR
jgi:hypothetical protein